MFLFTKFFIVMLLSCLFLFSGVATAKTPFEASVNNAQYAMNRGNEREAIKYWLQALNIDDSCQLCRRGVFRCDAEITRMEAPQMSLEFILKAIGLGDSLPIDVAFDDLLFLTHIAQVDEIKNYQLALDTTDFLLQNWSRSNQLNTEQRTLAWVERGNIFRDSNKNEEATDSYAKAMQLNMPLPQDCSDNNGNMERIQRILQPWSVLLGIVREHQGLATRYRVHLIEGYDKLEICRKAYPDDTSFWLSNEEDKRLIDNIR
jgi:tetratricopeptide (TPR) repeat protein